MAGKNGEQPGEPTRVILQSGDVSVSTTVEEMDAVRGNLRFPLPLPANVFPEKCSWSLAAADELEDVLARIITDCEEFEDLSETCFRVLWKKGTPDWYGKTKVKGEEDILLSNVDVVILISLARCFDTMLTYRQVEALLHQQLCHLQVDEAGALKTRSPDVVGFEANVKRFGAWLPAFVRFEQQLRLFETADKPEPAPALEPAGVS